MENTEMVLQEPTVLPQKSESEQIAELLRVMQGMAQMIRATHDRIRRAIKLGSGASNVREIPACEYKVTMNQVSMWDDYKVIRDIKTKAREQKG